MPLVRSSDSPAPPTSTTRSRTAVRSMPDDDLRETDRGRLPAGPIARSEGGTIRSR